MSNKSITLNYLKEIIYKNNLIDIKNIEKDPIQPGKINIICKKNYNKKQIKKITELLPFGIDYEIITNDF